MGTGKWNITLELFELVILSRNFVIDYAEINIINWHIAPILNPNWPVWGYQSINIKTTEHSRTIFIVLKWIHSSYFIFCFISTCQKSQSWCDESIVLVRIFLFILFCSHTLFINHQCPKCPDFFSFENKTHLRI